MFENPKTPKQLISALRILAMREPTTREELSTLQSDCTSLLLQLQTSPSLGHNMPHAVWHFLADADIRFKDPAYAQMQLTGLRAALAKWEHECAA